MMTALKMMVDLTKKITTAMKIGPRENAYNRRDTATRHLLLAFPAAQFVLTAYLVDFLKWVTHSMRPPY